jgi:hypothetical protein
MSAKYVWVLLEGIPYEGYSLLGVYARLRDAVAATPLVSGVFVDAFLVEIGAPAANHYAYSPFANLPFYRVRHIDD